MLQLDWAEVQGHEKVTNDEALLSEEVLESETETEVAPTSKTEIEAVSHSSVPDNASLENIRKLSSTTPNIDTPIIYKPPNRYSPDIEEWRSEFPISNYVSSEKISEPLKSFAHEATLSNVPTGI